MLGAVYADFTTLDIWSVTKTSESSRHCFGAQISQEICSMFHQDPCSGHSLDRHVTQGTYWKYFSAVKHEKVVSKLLQKNLYTL